MRFPEFIGGVLFEGINKAKQIRRIGAAFREDVNVIRHNAIGMKRKILLRGGSEKLVQQPTTKLAVEKDGCAEFGADGDKVEAMAQIVAASQAERWFIERHVASLE